MKTKLRPEVYLQAAEVLPEKTYCCYALAECNATPEEQQFFREFFDVGEGFSHYTFAIKADIEGYASNRYQVPTKLREWALCLCAAAAESENRRVARQEARARKVGAQ